MRSIILFFSDLPNNEPGTDFGIKAFVDTIFGSSVNSITLMEWQQFCDKNLIFADRPLE